jgi:replication-associated recombination protein RarA
MLELCVAVEQSDILGAADVVLETGKKVCIGIYGMPGIGKTTIAQRLKVDLDECFDKVIFIAIGQTPVVQQLLQDQFRDLASSHERMPAVFTSEFSATAACKQLAGMLGGRRTLLILDDVWHQRHLADLDFATINSDNSKNRIVVTTRNRQIFGGLCRPLDECHLVEMQLLSNENARKLLLHHAFPRETAPSGFEDSIDGILRECKCLPLALQVRTGCST